MENLIISLFNISRNDIERFETANTDKGFIVHIRLKRKKDDLFCKTCGYKLNSNGIIVRKINHKILTDRKTTLLYEARRYRCRRCGYSEYEKNPFSLNGFSNSILTVNQVMIDLHDYRLNYTMIAEKNDISTNEVIRYFDSFVQIPHISLPENLGIDEIHSDMAKRKDASYLGVLTDNDNFKLIDILPSRSKWELNNFLSTYSINERRRVKYVTIDMWYPYKEMALKWFPDCIIAVDPFHVIEHLTFDFTKIRIRIMNHKIYGSNSYYLLKHWHKLLESDDYDLNGKGKYNHVFKQVMNYGDLKKMLLELDEELTLAYELKEAYRDFNSRCTYEKAADKLDELISLFQSSNIKEYEEFTGIMKTWRKEIINSFIRSDKTGDRLSNAKSEAMNENIKTHIRISKGLGNFNRFRRRMMYCFNDKVFVILTDKLTSLKRNSRKKGENR